MSTPIDTAQPFYLQSQVGTTVNPDFQGGTLRDDQINAIDNNNYTVENFATNTIDAFGQTTTFSGTFSGAGPLTITSSVPNGTVVFTGASALSGAVVIDNGATMQWGAGNSAFLVGGGNAVVDNGALVMNFGGGGIGGAIPISGTGGVEIQSGALTQSGASTYTGVTKIDAGGFLNLSGAGSIANSSNVTANGVLDISGTSAGASITTLNGAGGVSLGGQALTLTAASGTFSGVMADGGLFGGTGGGLTIAGGIETLTGANTYTGATTINTGAALQLGSGRTAGTVAGAIVDNGLVLFNYSGPVTLANSFSGSGSAVLAAGKVVVTGTDILSGLVEIDNGATMQWGAGGPAFLVGGGDAVVDDGALVLNFGGGGIAGAIPILGTGRLEIQAGSLNQSGASSYTGVTTIDAGGLLVLSGTGSIADSSNVTANGVLDISGTSAGASITTLIGSAGVSLGAQTLTLTAASGTFSGVMADGGLFGGTGGGLTIAGGTETLTGANTYTGATTINTGATLKLSVGGGGLTVTGPVAGAGTLAIIGGTVKFNAGATLSIAKVAQSGGTSTFNTSLTYAGAWSQSAGGLAVAGARALTFSGSGDKFAGTVGGAGTLGFTGGTAAFNTGATLSIAKVAQSGGTVDLNTSLAYAGVWSQSGGSLVLASGRTLTLSGSGDKFAGTVAGAGTLALIGGTAALSAGASLSVAHLSQSGGATVTVSGAPSCAGVWTQTSGVISVGAAATLKLTGTGDGFAGTVDGAGTLALAGGTDAFKAGAALTVAKVAQSGVAAVTFATTLSYVGVWSQGAGAISVAAGDTLTFSGTGNLFKGTLTGAGAVALKGGSDGLQGATLAGHLNINGAAVTLSGTLKNSGVVTAASSGIVVALAGATLTGGGQLTLTNLATNKIEGAGSAATLTNVNNVISGAGQLGGGQMILVNEAGGTITANAATALVINTGVHTISNAGALESDSNPGLTIVSAVNNTGTLIAQGGTLTLEGVVTGAGTAVVNAGTLIAQKAFSENVAFGTTGRLVLADSQAYAGGISNFSKTKGTSLDLEDIAFSTAHTSYSGTSTAGVLTVTDGAHSAKIHFIGNYTAATWVLSKDTSGGTIVVDPVRPVAPIAALLIQSATGFGFGDSASHAPVLSPDGAERMMLAMPHGRAP